MIIKKRVRDIRKYLPHIQPDNLYYLGLEITDDIAPILEKLGFSIPPIPGESILPSRSPGAARRRNAEGYFIIHRDQPKETAYRQAEWHWKQFDGRDSVIEMSKIVDIPYQRYPRTPVPPYAVELTIKTNENDSLFVVAGPFKNSDEDQKIGTNTAQMLFEIFKEFEIFDETLDRFIKVPVRKLNWLLLPPGNNPWESAEPVISKVVSGLPKGNQPVIQSRLESIKGKNPEFIGVGLGGFNGYIVFGFPKQNFCILESPFVNNATYVLNSSNWETISQLTKAQILSFSIHKARLIHNQSWYGAMDRLFE